MNQVVDTSTGHTLAADEEGFHEFVQESRDAFEDIEHLLARLDNTIDDTLLTELIRRLHSVSSSLRISGCGAIAALGQNIVAILDRLQKDELPRNDITVDVILFSTEYFQYVTEVVLTGEVLDQDTFLRAQEHLHTLTFCEVDEADDRAVQALKVLTAKNNPDVATSEEYPSSCDLELLGSVDVDPSTGEVADESVKKLAKATDLAFFRDLMQKIEYCNPEWRGRGQTIFNITEAMNREAGFPVDSMQLEAAVYMHDFGMAFLPRELIKRPGKLNDEERQFLYEHPLVGAEMLYRMNGWDDAVKIVMQHHEREDGKGYPEGITGDAICDGAKILAIVDTVYAMTHKQAYRDFGRPFLRAVFEINNCTGTQFSKDWVDIFNDVVRRHRGTLLSDTAGLGAADD